MKVRRRTVFLVAAALGFCQPGHRPATAAGPRNHDSELVPAKSRFTIDSNRHQVVCEDALGKIRWSTRLDGYLGSVRPPHLVSDSRRVYVTHQDGVTALDVPSGKVLWHSQGPHDRLLLSRGLLLATDCSCGEDVARQGRWLTARKADDGKEVFRVRLPFKDFDPCAIEQVAGLFLVQTNERPQAKERSLFVDRKGVVCYRLNRQIVDGRRLGKDVVLLTDHHVVRLSPAGHTRWRVPLREEWIAGGGLLEVEGGDLLAFLYGRINDSGVQVVRFNPATGNKVWSAKCARLGVGHSKYRHQAMVLVKGGRIEVTSRGSHGTFVELLDLRSGRRIKRTLS